MLYVFKATLLTKVRTLYKFGEHGNSENFKPSLNLIPFLKET